MKYQAKTRIFDSIADMDNHMIAIWNKHIGTKDTVYVVGDFSFYRDMEKNREILGLLKGKKILIRGNHDKATTKELLAAGFDDVRDELIIRFSNDEMVLLKHYQYDSPWYVRWFNRLSGRLGMWKKHYAFYPIDKGMWLIHGHHHGVKAINGRQINVNVDSWNYRPIGENEICAIINDYKLTRRFKWSLSRFLR